MQSEISFLPVWIAGRPRSTPHDSHFWVVPDHSDQNHECQPSDEKQKYEIKANFCDAVRNPKDGLERYYAVLGSALGLGTILMSQKYQFQNEIFSHKHVNSFYLK